MVKEVDLNKMLEDATENFTTGFMCSESVLDVLNRHYELGIGEEAIAMSTGFPYGFGDGGNVEYTPILANQYCHGTISLAVIN